MKQENDTNIFALDDENALFEDNVEDDEKSAEETALVEPDENAEKSDEEISMDEILDEPDDDILPAEKLENPEDEKEQKVEISVDSNSGAEQKTEENSLPETEKTDDSENSVNVQKSETEEIPCEHKISPEPEKNISEPENEPEIKEDSEESQSDEEQKENRAENAYENLVDKVSEVLPKLSTFIENSEEAAKFQKEIELFKRLRQFGESLPFEQRAKFLAGRVRLLLDYIIARLSGRPGLLTAASEIRRQNNLPVDSMETAINGSDRPAIVNVLKDMENLTFYLEDKNLSKALIVAAEEVVDKLS